MNHRPIEPLPENTRHLIQKNTHPGLMLDKYARSWDPSEQLAKLSAEVQGPTIDAVVNRTREAPQDLCRDLLARRKTALCELQALTFEAQNLGPLTLHLSRASALENAGICMHRIYGFTYLPGTSLKGMARAYAETVWLPSQFEADETGDPRDHTQAERAREAWRNIESVFGYSPGSDRGKSWKPKGVPPRSTDDATCAGGVIFHDAWPATWPPLIKDILNCHHPEYYRQAQAPGDWEDPIPVYFLAVPAGATFHFALSARSGANTGLVEQAGQWLIGALASQGVGAKTNSGYGAFKVTSVPEAARSLPSTADTTWRALIERGSVAELATTLTLITPAFLAGANQQASDCDLRPATLRGLLRWWWRTMHAGFLDPKTLHELESLIWGDTQAGGAVRIVLDQTSDILRKEYDYKDPYDAKPWFKEQHALGDKPNGKTTQGLFYASYGMDETSRGEARRRHYVNPGAQWSLRLIARRADRGAYSLTAAEVLAQAEAALWLLCHFGSCGSKARKGFGSLGLAGENLQNNRLDQCRFAAAGLRDKLRLGNRFNPSHAQSAALGPPQPSWCERIEVAIPSADPWQVMDHVGFSYQAVAQRFAHNPRKVSLGLPRKIHGPRNEPMKNQERSKWRRPDTLQSSRPRSTRNAQNERYASPVWIHVDAQDEGHMVRAIAFPAAFLPDVNESREFLREFLQRFAEELAGPLRPCSRRGGPRRGGPSAGGVSQGSQTRQPSPATRAGGSELPRSGEQVEAELLDERTKKGGWRARHLASGISGPIQNSGDVPSDKKPGDRLPLIVQSANPREIAFKYPTEALLEQQQKRRGKRPGKGPGRR